MPGHGGSMQGVIPLAQPWSDQGPFILNLAAKGGEIVEFPALSCMSREQADRRNNLRAVLGEAHGRLDPG